jgi:hypothetical protein
MACEYSLALGAPGICSLGSSSNLSGIGENRRVELSPLL